MAKYKGRVPSSNIDDIRTGRGSPDDRQEQKYKRNRYLDENYIKNLRNEVAARNAPPLPKPDPRTKMPGGELAIGENMSREDFWQQNAEQAWIYSHSAIKNRQLDKFLGIFEYWNTVDKNDPDKAQFLLDTFKRARSVGYPIHTINEQPAPLPSKFKVKSDTQLVSMNWNDPEEVMTQYKRMKQLNQLLNTMPRGPSGKLDQEVIDHNKSYDKLRIDMMKNGYAVG